MPEIATESRRWGFIGAGKMATALIQGMLKAGTACPANVIASDPVPTARESLGRACNVSVVDENLKVVSESDVIVLAVKPQTMTAVLAELRPALTPNHLVISIAAGATISSLAAGLGVDRRIVRVMPNTPALVGEGASAYCLGPGVGSEDEQLVRSCLLAVGIAHKVPESQLDAVTGLSGSGPAFVYAIIEALSDGGVRAGLPREVATSLAAQTVLGSARMVLETGLHTGTLKDQVTSPGGTTIAGIHALERGGLRAALMDAVRAAADRSAELAEAASKGALPMKLGLISDLHGDPVALELAWSHLTVLGADRIVCAGDLVGYGPLPDKVVEFVQERGVSCVRGNHDRWALERGPGVPDSFRGGMPSADTLAFLKTLPFDLILEGDGKVIVLVHGSIHDDLEFVTRKDHPPKVLDAWLDSIHADVLVVGHTHDPMMYRSKSGLVVNPGSVISAPVVTTSRTFALLDLPTLEVTIHDVETGGRIEPRPWSTGKRGPSA